MAMINDTIILLTYYYDQEDCNHPMMKYVKVYCGAYLPFNLYLTEPLEKIFSKVIVYDYLKRRAEIGIKAMNKEVIDLVKKENPRYVLWTSFYYDFEESTMVAIRKNGAMVVGWFFDDEWRFDDYSRWQIPNLDYVVTNALDAVPKYKDLNARCIYTIPNTGIAIDRDWSNFEEKYDISFVGSIMVADRRKYLDELVKVNLPVRVFGPGTGGYIPFEQMIDVFKISKINLNFSKANHDQFKQIKGRVFQVCLAGGFLLTEYAQGIENFFEPNKEIVCFTTGEEMISKAIYYLNHEEERQKIAQAGWKKAINHYTSSCMVKDVFYQIELDIADRNRERNTVEAPKKYEMPPRAYILASKYHFDWARALSEAYDKTDLWKDSIEMSLSYNPENISARYYHFVNSLPVFIRFPFFILYAFISKVMKIWWFVFGKSLQYIVKIKHTLEGKVSRN